MSFDALDEVLSSRVRLRIVAAVSTRPRTLKELAEMTGISVQGVLRHLKRLMEVRVVEEQKLVPRTPKARRVYSAKSSTFGDYSSGGLTIVSSTQRLPPTKAAGHQELERMAGEVLLQRRRVTEQAKKMSRMIDELVERQEALELTLGEGRFSAEERLVLRVLLTEETIEDGERVLARYYGLKDRRSIDRALAKARRVGSS